MNFAQLQQWFFEIGIWVFLFLILWFLVYRSNKETVALLKRNHYVIRDLTTALKDIQQGLASITTDLEVGIKHRLEDLRHVMDETIHIDDFHVSMEGQEKDSAAQTEKPARKQYRNRPTRMRGSNF